MIYRLTRDKSIGRKKLTSLIFLFFLFPISLFSEEIPSFDSIRKSYLNSDLSLYDYNGFKLHTIRINPQKRQLNWIPVEKIPSHLTAILILAEDKRFHEHEGVDYIALLSAFKDMLLLRNKRGASTITMQLVSFLFPSLISGSSGRSISQKLKQISLAKALEERWSKRGILEAYLNLASYRGELKGIDAAARGLFRKDSSSLNQLESIILISLLKNPQASRKRITQRACYIASKLEQAPSCAKLQEKVHKIKKNYYIPQEE
ncbi:MAG: transglycosylase domain-containing protein, partial [Leptospiraceae bacterium]|nr:transglycosylase domain-containing protein [Leptospiraceae bacterium]